MFNNALSHELEYPSNYISKELASLLSMMLHKDQAKRITKGQANKIKNHVWLKDVNWTDVLTKKTKPPFQPSMTKSNFDPEYVRDYSAKLARIRPTP